MLDYLSLAAVAAVAREGSFEKAAIALGVTPSAVSQRIKGLEERLGAVLLTRGAPCRPTEIGTKLCAHVEQVRLLESELVGDLPGPPSGDATPSSLRIAVNADSLGTWFTKAASLFAAQTGALLDLVLADEAHTAEHLRTGEVLAAVTADAAPVVGCRTYPLGEMEYVAICSSDFMRRHFPAGIDAQSLQAAPMLRFDRRDQLQAKWAQDAWGARISPPTHWTPSTQGMLDMTLAGLGWSVAPVPLAAPILEAKGLIEMAPKKRVRVKLYWQRTRLVARILDQLTEAVRTVARSELVQAT